jgi:hypothetical protein
VSRLLRLVAFGSVFCVATYLKAEEQDAPKSLPALVSKLGSENFKDREQAERELPVFVEEALWKIDLKSDGSLTGFESRVLGPVRALRDDGDAEVQQRARGIHKALALDRFGPGVAGWALYAATLEFAKAPVPPDSALTMKDADTVLMVRSQKATRAQCDLYIVGNLATHDPQGTLERLEKAELGFMHHENAIAVIADAWARKDIGKAFAWSKELPASRERGRAISRVLKNWPVDRKYDEALPEAERLCRDVDSLYAMTACCHIAGVIATSDPRAAFEWADSLPKNSFLGNMYDSIVTAAAGRNYDVVRELCIQHRGDADYAKIALLRWELENDRRMDVAFVESVGEIRRSSAEYFYLKQLATYDVEAAIRRLAKLRDSTLPQAVSTYRNGVASTAEGWAAKDPEAAFQWLSELSDIGVDASAWQYLPGQLARKDPQAAAALVDKIVHRENRQHAALAVARFWLPVDRDAALRFLEEQKVVGEWQLDPNWGVIGVLAMDDPIDPCIDKYLTHREAGWIVMTG